MVLQVGIGQSIDRRFNLFASAGSRPRNIGGVT
jgi:hypothetical protein